MITREGGQLALGIAVGAFVFLPIIIFFDLVSTQISLNDTIIGAIVGGAIAGLVSLGAQSSVIFDNLRRSEQDRSAKQLAQAQSVFVKLQDCVDHYQKLRNYYLTHDPKYCVVVNHDFFIWKPLFGKSYILNFSIDEKAMFLNTKNIEL